MPAAGVCAQPQRAGRNRMNVLFTMSNSAPNPQPLSGTEDRQTFYLTDENIPGSTRSGGARRDRTDDLMLAKHALSQLSYGPFRKQRSEAGGQTSNQDHPIPA